MSNGKDAVLVATADAIDAANYINLGFVSFPIDAVNLSLHSSYVTSIATLREIALAIVGVAPLQQDVIPSSLTILPNASKTCL